MATEWFCRIRGQLRGPLSPQDLKALATAGQLAPDSLVRQGTAGAWVKAGRVKGLFQSGAAVDAKARPETSAATEDRGGVVAVGDLPDLGSALGDLGDLPALAATGSAKALPIGRPVEPVLPLGQVAPVGATVPTGMPLPTGTLLGGGPLLVEPTLTASGRADPTRRERSPAAEKGKLSSARVMSVGIVAVVLSFLGLCFVLHPIIPVVLGAAGVLTALRAMMLAGSRHRAALAAAGAGAILGLVAAGWGLNTTLSMDDPQGWLNANFGGALTGAPVAPQGSKGPLLHWHQAPEDVALAGDMRIQITGASVGHLPGREANAKAGATEDEKIYLMISVRLENVSNRKVDYVSYSGTVRGAEPPLLRDDLGSNYSRVTTPGLSGQLRRESLYPGKAQVDLMVFERPVPSYQQLELTLPGSAFGDTEPVRFKIPRSMVEVDDTSAPPKGAEEPAASPIKPKVVEIRSEGEDKEPVQSPPKADEK